MLVATGTPDEKAADAFSQEWEKKGIVEKQRQREAKWIEPSDPALHRMLALPSEEIRGWEFLEVERTIAEQAGFSVVSDYFVSSSMLVPEEARAGMPLWRLLYTLREPSHYEWKQAGDCLVFHREDWYAQVPGQIPESLILAYRERLKKQGAFTLDDLATFAVALRGRPIPWDAVPADLQQAGIVGAAVFPTAFLLYASLTPEQQAKARSESGLSFPEMTRAQQESVRQRAAGFPTPVPVDDVPRTVFRVKESVAVRDSVRWLGCSLNLVFPDRPDETAVEIPLPLAAAKPGP
jgi:hypothetical protein